MKKDYFPQLISEICHEYGIELITLNNSKLESFLGTEKKRLFGVKNLN